MPDHPVSTAIAAAIGKLAAFRPTRIVGEPDQADAHGLADDLLTLAAVVDPIIEAIGDYAQSALGVPATDVQRYFRDQLRGALDGNATWCITQAVAGQQESGGLGHRPYGRWR